METINHEPEAKLLTREEVSQAVLAALLPHECDGRPVTAFHRAAEICYKLFGEEDV